MKTTLQFKSKIHTKKNLPGEKYVKLPVLGAQHIKTRESFGGAILIRAERYLKLDSSRLLNTRDERIKWVSGDFIKTFEFELPLNKV